MWKFYRRVVLSAPTEFWSATDRILTWTAVGLFLFGIFNRKIVENIKF
jgi:hypothetical protein